MIVRLRGIASVGPEIGKNSGFIDMFVELASVSFACSPEDLQLVISIKPTTTTKICTLGQKILADLIIILAPR